jgi:hypothetical protein
VFWAVSNDVTEQIRTPDRDSSLAHLKATYPKHLANLFAVKVEADQAMKAAADAPAG